VSLDNRELASLVWLTALATFALLKRDVRQSLLGVAKLVLSSWKILVPLLSIVVWTILLVMLGRRIGVWNPDLMKYTVIWFVGTALEIFVKLGESSTNPRFLREAALHAATFGVVLAFFVGLFVLPLWIEIPLQLLLALLVLCALVTRTDENLKGCATAANILLLVVVAGLLTYNAVRLLSEWDTLDLAAKAREFALPLWLTLGVLPLIYLVALISAYESAFMRINFIVEPPAQRQSKLALLTTLRGRAYLVGAFRGEWLEEMNRAGSPKEARALVKRYRNPKSADQISKRLGL